MPGGVRNGWHQAGSHSYEETGRDRFVEVKTTRYGKRTPFYISAGEIRFSKANSDAYQLYRVFEFRERPSCSRYQAMSKGM